MHKHCTGGWSTLRETSVEVRNGTSSYRTFQAPQAPRVSPQTLPCGGLPATALVNPFSIPFNRRTVWPCARLHAVYQQRRNVRIRNTPAVSGSALTTPQCVAGWRAMAGGALQWLRLARGAMPSRAARSRLPAVARIARIPTGAFAAAVTLLQLRSERNAFPLDGG